MINRVFKHEILTLVQKDHIQQTVWLAKILNVVGTSNKKEKALVEASRRFVGSSTALLLGRKVI